VGIRLFVRSSWSEPQGTPFQYEFDQERVVIGRGTGADICLPHAAVSILHATIRIQGAGYVVEDEGSTNGTRVNGKSLPPKRPKALANGDQIELGGFTLEFTGGVPIAEATSSLRTGALARRIVREAMGPEPDAVEPVRIFVVNGPDEGTSYPIPPPPARLVVGRAAECDIVLRDADASREHVELVVDLDGVDARDLGSKNGFHVNERAVTHRRLKHADELRIGTTRLRHDDPAETLVLATASANDAAYDVPMAPDPVPTPGSPETTPSPAATSSPTPDFTPPPTGRARTGRSADAIIYVLAAVVLALSIAALVVLLQSS
jgi:pSer/pThr/pTyr-binding forkhead associated (FHA) protein